jgi:hypothetical protein
MPSLSREQIKFKVGKINFDRGKEVPLGRHRKIYFSLIFLSFIYLYDLILQYFETGAVSGLSHQGHTVRAKCQVP